MDSRLMVMMEVEKVGHKFVFNLPQGAPYRSAFEALTEIQTQLLEWQRIQEEQQATAAAQQATTSNEQTSA